MKKFLIVVDMQKDFVDGALGTPEAVAIVDNVCKKIKEYAVPEEGVTKQVIVTFDTHADNYMETLEGANLPVPHCIAGTPGHALDEKVEEALMESGILYAILEKPTFGSVDLPGLILGILGENACENCILDVCECEEEDFEIELIGLCTDICVVSNALYLKANFYEKKITVDASCCAGVTPETHAAALATMKMCQINVINE